MHRFRRLDLLALVFLALLTLLFFWPVAFNLGWIPRGGGDLVSLLWPHYSYAAQSLAAGRLPFWNPTLHSGAPFAADNQISLFYPVNLLTFFLAPSLPYVVVEWLVVFHFWLAGASMYFLMRVLIPTPDDRPHPSRLVLPPLFSAVAFMFSDVFVTHVGNLNLNAVSAWLPAAFAALHLALTRRAWGWAAGAGVLLSLATLAGHAQMTFIVALALGLYALWHIGRSGQSRVRLIAVTALTFGVALGLTAFVLIPGVELARDTARVKLDYAAASAYSIPWTGLAGLFSPLIFGRGPADFWGPWDRVELGYLGVLPLFFAGLTPFKDRRGVPLFMGLLGIFALLVALGANTPLHRLLYLVVPGFAGMRVPARFILLTDFALAALAGLGLHHLTAVSRKRLWVWSAALLVIALTAMLLDYRSAVSVTGTPHPASLKVGMALAIGLLLSGAALATFLGAKPQSAAPVLALILLAADLIGQGAWVEVDHTDPTLGFQHPAVIAFLQAQPGPTRMDNASGVWAPSAAARYGLEDVNGTNHALVLAAYETYLGAVGARGSPQYNFLNAQFVVADKGQPPGDSTFVPVFNEDPAVDIYLNTGAMPRVSLVYSATVVPNGEAAFSAVHAPGFDPLFGVVVTREGDRTPPAGTAATPAGGSNLYYLSYAPESFSVVAQTPAPAYLVFSEVWYPGWRAWVDGAEVPIFRANFAFRGVYLRRPGEHTVVMRFDPVSWKIGLSMTLLTLVAIGGWTGVWFYRRLHRDRREK